MMLMLHHATGLPVAASHLLKRTLKSFIFFDVLLHGQEILTNLPLVERLIDRISDKRRVGTTTNGDITVFSGEGHTFRQLVLYR